MSEPDEPPEHAVQPHTPVQGRNKRKQLTTGKVRKVNSEKRDRLVRSDSFRVFSGCKPQRRRAPTVAQLSQKRKFEISKFFNFGLFCPKMLTPD